MGVSKTQVVRFLKQGADAVNIIVSGDNIVFTDAGQILEVSVEAYIGAKKLQYGDGSGDAFLCSTLSADKRLFDGNGQWSFRIDDNNTKFVYRIKLSNKIDLVTTIPYTVTVNDIAYNKSISVSTVYKGERGATPRGPQNWESLNTGYRFFSGADGEPYLDFVVYKNNYYLCKKSHNKSIVNYPTSSFDSNSGLWQLSDKIDMVATQLLLATYIRVKNLGAGAIEMEDEEGNLVFVAKDGNVTCKTGTFENVDVSGIVRAKLIYSTIKNLLVTDADHASPYYIDPVNNPCDTIFVTTNGSKWIYLPDVNKYNGMEIGFFQSVMTTMVYGEVYVAAINNQKIAYNTTTTIVNGKIVPQKVSGVGHADTRIKLVSNEYTKLKAISGYWYVISGVVTEE